MNPRDLQRQMMKAQEQMAEQLASMSLEGSAGGGAVVITLSGDFQVRSVKIDPDAVDAEDVGALEDLVSAALTDALGKTTAAQEEAQQKMQSAALSGIKLPPGMGI
jgi:DNA-binding YbaB/EbfC family protein